MRVSLVLPAFNEGRCIGALLDRAAAVLDPLDLSYEIIVVDDGSGDETVEVVRERSNRIPIRIVLHETNRGYGSALQSGLYAVEANADVIVTMDADDSHDPALIPDMLAAIDVGSDLVIASRMQRGGGVVGVPLHRKLLSDAASVVFSLLIPLRGVRDFTSGYRAFRGDLVRSLVRDSEPSPLLSERGFAAGFELLIKACARGARISEVPLLLRYDRKLSDSRMRIVRTLKDYFWLLLLPPGAPRKLSSLSLARLSLLRAKPSAGSAVAATVLVDVAAVLASFAAGFLLVDAVMSGEGQVGSSGDFSSHMLTGSVFALTATLVLWRGGQYQRRASMLDLRLLQTTATAMLLSAAVFLALLFVAGTHPGSEALVIVSLALALAGVLLARRLAWSALRSRQLRNGQGRKILIYGGGDSGRLLLKKIMLSPRLGALVVGFIDNLKPIGSTVSCSLGGDAEGPYEAPVLGRIEDLEDIVRRHSVHELLIAGPRQLLDTMPDLLGRCEALGIDVGFVPRILDLRADQLRSEDISAIPVLRPDSSRPAISYAIVKRVLDIVLSAVLILITAPLWIGLAALIRMESEGPALFRQTRVGKDGKYFKILKFRTLRLDAEEYARSPESDSDPRVTRVGRYVRNLGLDELPQLINVLRGDMSLVGPRPEMPYIVAGYGQLERRRLEVLPGITGLWQLSPDRSQTIHANIEYDLYYIRNRSLTLDFLILGETALFLAKNIWAAVQRMARTGSEAKSVPGHGLEAAERYVPQPAMNYVFVALDQRRRRDGSESWGHLIPAIVQLSKDCPVKILTASCNRRELDALVTGTAAGQENGEVRLPEYLEYSTGDSLRNAAAEADVVVTDLPHVADWAASSGSLLVRVNNGTAVLEGGRQEQSADLHSMIRDLLSLDGELMGGTH